MNTIPSELIAIPRAHGYFWHPTEEVVYSLKVSGILRALKKQPARTWNHTFYPEGFTLSRNGRRFRFSIGDLRRILPHPYQVPYYKDETRYRF